MVIEDKFQRVREKVVVWSDTDFSGCKRTRRSTSEGVMMFGGHCVKTYSQTQGKIALSSRESEFYWIVMIATRGLGMKGLLGDLGVDVKLQVNTEGIASRGGAVRARHIEVPELAVQDRVATGELSVVNVKGEENVADGLAKHADRQKMDQYVEACNMVRRRGRHELSPRLGDGKRVPERVILCESFLLVFFLHVSLETVVFT